MAHWWAAARGLEIPALEDSLCRILLYCPKCLKHRLYNGRSTILDPDLIKLDLIKAKTCISFVGNRNNCTV